jgi:hypothetical protein
MKQKLGSLNTWGFMSIWNQVLAVDRANGRTCLHYAAKGGHIECVCKILTAAETGPVANSWYVLQCDKL